MSRIGSGDRPARRRCAALLLASLIVGCSSPGNRQSETASPVDTVATSTTPKATSDHEAGAALQDTVRLYLARLGDRTFWEHYGEAEEPQRWYLASERLGQIGAPAIPGLIGKLEDRDAFVVMQALYALMLASQDSAVTSRTGGEYVRYTTTVLDSTTNAANLEVARAWWARHRGGFRAS